MRPAVNTSTARSAAESTADPIDGSGGIGIRSFTSPVPRTEMLKLRRFEEPDTAAVWELHNLALQDAGAHAGNGPWDDDLRAIHASYLEDGGECLVGLIDDRIVAMGALRHITDSVAEVKRMRMHPRLHRRGFGRLVLERLERRASELGYAVLRLDTTVVQIAAQQLYRSAGYREAGRGRLAGFELIFFEKRCPKTGLSPGASCGTPRPPARRRYSA